MPIIKDGYRDKRQINKKKICLFMKIDKKGTLVKGINKKVVRIPKGVTVIGVEAFKDCDKIEEVILPKGLTIIGDNAFENCTSLKTIAIDDGVTVRRFAFKNCTSLESVTLPNDLQCVQECTFYNCSSLKKIIIPNNVIEIATYAFYDCCNLEDVKFSSNTVFIHDYAFLHCKLPKHLELPNNVSHIGSCAFRGISSEEIILPENLEFIWACAFIESNLKKIVIPKTVQEIDRCVFKDCKQLEEVVIECNIKELEEEMFCGCSALQKIVLPESLELINSRSFKECVFRKIDIPKGVKKIRYETFENCKNLKEIELPDAIDTIEHLTFSNCLSLKNVRLPNNLREIGNNAFDGCINLENLTINNNIRYISENVFKGCLSLDLNIETSLFDFSSHRNSHNVGCKTFEVKNLNIYGKKIDIRSVYTCGEMVDEIDRIRKEELLDKFKAKLKELNVNLIVEVILNAYIEKIIRNFNSGSIYNYEKDFNDYLLKYIDDIKGIYVSNKVISETNNQEKMDSNQSIKEIEDEYTKNTTNNKFIQIIYNEKLCSIPLDFNILMCIEQQDDIKILFENNYIVRDGAANEITFNINNALRRAFIHRLSRLSISEELKEYLKGYDKYIGYKDSTSIISIKTMVNELAYIYYLEYTSKLNDMNLIENPLNSVRLDKGLDKRLVKILNKN